MFEGRGTLEIGKSKESPKSLISEGRGQMCPIWLYPSSTNFKLRINLRIPQKDDAYCLNFNTDYRFNL